MRASTRGAGHYSLRDGGGWRVRRIRAVRASTRGARPLLFDRWIQELEV